MDELPPPPPPSPPPVGWDGPRASVPLPSGPPSPWSPGGSGDVAPPPAWIAGVAPVGASPVAAKARRSRRWAAVAAVGVLAIGGIGAALVLRRSGPATQSSPESAVQSFLGALQDRDLLGAAETLPKAERNLLVDVLADLRDVKSADAPSDASLHAFDAYTLKIDGLTTNTEAVTDSIAVVELTGGTYTATGDGTKLPFGIGKTVSKMAEDDAGARTSDTARGTFADRGDPVRLATVRDADGWHVSMFYTVAELARADAGLPAPDPAERIAAKGADTPEDAVRQMVEAASKGRWARLVELTPPDEMAALHDYGTMLLNEAPAPPATPFFTVTKLDFESRDVRGGKVLKVTAVAGSTEVDGKTLSLEASTPEPGCYHVVVKAEGEKPVDETQCAKDGFNAGDSGLDLTTEQVAELQAVSDLAGVAVVQVDGKWYVSPARTIGRLLPAMVVGVQTFFAGIDGLAGGFGSAVNGDITPIAPCPTDDSAADTTVSGRDTETSIPFC